MLQVCSKKKNQSISAHIGGERKGNCFMDFSAAMHGSDGNCTMVEFYYSRRVSRLHAHVAE